MKHVAGECPDLETIAACLDGRLSDRERKRITEHLAVCEHCYTLFNESAQTHVAATPARSPIAERWRAWVTVPRLAWSSAGAALATAACVWLIVGSGRMMPSRQSNSELQDLVAAVGTERPIEARLTGGFAYGQLRGPLRAGTPSSSSVSPDVRIAAARIEKAMTAHRTPSALKSLGIAYLMMGDIDRAVPVLEEAADQPTKDAQVQNDLAAAYLTRAIQNNEAQDLTKALTMVDRAVKADGRLSEAWFNRASALERLSLVDQARQAWQDYLKVDGRSGWAAEAREHVRALDGLPQSGDEFEQEKIGLAARRRDEDELRKLVHRSPDIAREWLQEQLLSAWSKAVLDGTTHAASETLAVGALVARELAAATGDRFMADAVAVAATASRSGGRATELARGHQVFRSASADYNQDRIRESVKQFEAALRPLDDVNSPFAAWTRYYLAVGSYYAGDFPGALRSLDPLIHDGETRGYHRLLGLTHRLRGLIYVVTGQFAAGWEEYRAASVSFERAGDVDNAASMQALIAEDLDFLGETGMAWSALSKGLSRLSMVRDPRHRHTILQDAALASLREGFPESALYFEQATLENAKRWGRPLAIVNAHMYTGEMQRQVGNTDLAMAALREARSALSQITDPQLVARDESQIQLAQGEVEWRTRPAEAVASLSRALDTFTRTKTNWPIVRVHLARGRAHLASGREDLAEADFAAGIDVFESQRASVTNEALRSASFERPWDLFTEMIRFQAVNRHRPDRALAFAERARARTLLEALSPDGRATPVDPIVARASLPPAVTVLYYAALDDRLLIWTLTRERLNFVDTPVRHAQLTRLLDQFRSDMAGPSFPARDTPSLTSLYDVLIRPIADSLTNGSRVIVVPDGVLHAVPFAALLRREDRRYLVEDHALAVTPSLTVFLATSAKPPTAAAGWSTALVMGNPGVAAGSADAPPDLPEAEAEAKEVAALYRTSSLLLGARATKADFILHAGQYDVVHFAGHAIANDVRPELSRLLFAGADETARSLFARDIATERFSATRLVVLGACSTSAGRIRRGEGVLSLARPFLAAGVPAVVASLWDVNDRASHRLLVAFHRALRRSGDVAEALRRAQLELMGDPDPLLQLPSAWAGFTTIFGRAVAAERAAH